MSNRLIKQLVYSAFYLVVFVGISLLVYFVYFRPAPSCFDNKQNQNEEGVDCGAVCGKICLGSDFRPLFVVGNPKIFNPVGDSPVLFAAIKNPNSNYAARHFAYQFNLFDEKGILKNSWRGRSFIYSNETKYVGVFLSGQKIDFTNKRLELVIEDEKWAYKNQFEKPALEVQNARYKLRDKTVEVNGVVVNQDIVPIKTAVVFVVFYDKVGVEAGVSQTEISDIEVSRGKPFTVLYPLGEGALDLIDLAKTKVFVYGRRP